MQFAILTPPRSTAPHIAEEVLLPFKDMIQSRVLCGSIHGGSVFRRPIPYDLNREKWLGHPEAKIDTTGVKCKRCLSRYEVRFQEFLDAV